MWRYGTQKCNPWCLNANKEKWGVLSLAFPEPQPLRGAGQRKRTGFTGVTPSASLPTSPKEPQGKNKPILQEITAPAFIIFKKTAHKTNNWVTAKANLYPQKQEWYQFIHGKTCQAEDSFVEIPNLTWEAK